MPEHARSDPDLPASILVGVDEGDLSDHAVRMGLELGRHLGSRVDLVHAALTPPDYWPGIDPVYGARLTGELVARTRRDVNEHVRALLRGSAGGAGAGGASARATGALAASPGEDLVRVIPGLPAKVLLAEARDARAGLLVLGGHHRRGVLDFGGTVRAVFAKAHVPVWIQAQPVRAIETILAPVDLSKESLEALSLACSLARVFGARVRAMECFHGGAATFALGLDFEGSLSGLPVAEIRKAELANFERAMKEFDWKGIDPVIEFVDGEPVERILGSSREVDLIVLGTHGRTGLASTLLGGVAYSVFRHADKPVLAVRDSERSFLI